MASVELISHRPAASVDGEDGPMHEAGVVAYEVDGVTSQLRASKACLFGNWR
jgi:hypothetical protein